MPPEKTALERAGEDANRFLSQFPQWMIDSTDRYLNGDGSRFGPDDASSSGEHTSANSGGV
jgi:hypothetical protein